jgi:hypothetical protein
MATPFPSADPLVCPNLGSLPSHERSGIWEPVVEESRFLFEPGGARFFALDAKVLATQSTGQDCRRGGARQLVRRCYQASGLGGNDSLEKAPLWVIG